MTLSSICYVLECVVYSGLIDFISITVSIEYENAFPSTDRLLAKPFTLIFSVCPKKMLPYVSET